MRRCSRHAVTLIELLVVMAVIGILVAILLPAVQMARESARKSSCQNHLRQLGLATQTYDATHNMIPLSIGPYHVGLPGPKQKNGKGWIVGVLPDLGEQNLFDQFSLHFNGDFLAGQGLQALAARPLMRHRLPLLQCPSDGSAAVLSTSQWQWLGIEVATTNYKGVLGDSRLEDARTFVQSSHPGSVPDCHQRGPCNGLFWRTDYFSPASLATVTDGLSQTFMIGEDVPEHNNHSAAFYANGDWASCHMPLNYGPNPPRPDDWWDVIGFRSRHVGGAYFCYADGHVQFVHQDIGHDLYRALSTRARKEPIEAMPP